MRTRPDQHRRPLAAHHRAPNGLHLRPWWVAALLVFSFCFQPVGAQADELSEFEHARELYDSMRYTEALEAFSALVGTDPPRLRDALLVIESRKYLAASLVFEDRTEEARAQFEALVRAEPDYTIDPLAFPDQVVKLFDSVKRDLAAELRARAEADAKAREQAEAKRMLAERERRARLEVLATLAREQEVEVRRSRWLAAVPFGVGQIQNGHKGLGRFFAVSESILLVATVVTFAAHASLRNGRPAPPDVDAARQDERALRIANYTAFAGFFTLVGAGILDAQLRFEPKRTLTRERELPEDVDRWLEAELAGAGMRLRF